MIIEAGKYYKTRDGRKVGPMVQLRCNVFATRNHEVFDETSTWWEGGEADYRKQQHPHDLIAEWDASPVREVTCREIVSGEYGNLTVYRTTGNELRIEFNKSSHTAEELREAAHVLNQIAEAMSDA